MDTGSPVIDEYDAKMPFKFTGTLRKVEIKLGENKLTPKERGELQRLHGNARWRPSDGRKNPVAQRRAGTVPTGPAVPTIGGIAMRPRMTLTAMTVLAVDTPFWARWPDCRPSGYWHGTQRPPKTDPLPSWKTGTAKNAIPHFVKKTTTDGSPDFVAPADRIAVFDNDGTLWPENPVPFEVAYALDTAKAMMAKKPELKEKPAYKALAAGDVAALTDNHLKLLLELVVDTHAGQTTEEFDKTVADWIATAKHPRIQRLYSACTYLPMQEVLKLVRRTDTRRSSSPAAVRTSCGSGTEGLRYPARASHRLDVQVEVRVEGRQADAHDPARNRPGR